MLGQVSADVTDDQPARALRDLDLALRAEEAVLMHLRHRVGTLSESATQEHTANMGVLMRNMAYCHIRLNDPDEAERCADNAIEYWRASSGPRLDNAHSSDLELRGAIAVLRNDPLLHHGAA